MMYTHSVTTTNITTDCVNNSENTIISTTYHGEIFILQFIFKYTISTEGQNKELVLTQTYAKKEHKYVCRVINYIITSGSINGKLVF